MSIFREWFQCPGCGFRNTVEWSEGDVTTQEIDCVNCRRSVLPVNKFDKDGVLIGEDLNPMCTCQPGVVEAHFEGARFTVTKFMGTMSPKTLASGLDAIKMEHAKAVKAQVSSFIHQHYNQDQQMTLNALLTQSAMQANVTRATYVSQAMMWVNSVIKMYYPLRNAIAAATTPEQVMAVAFDPSQAPMDPGVTIEAALEM